MQRTLAALLLCYTVCCTIPFAVVILTTSIFGIQRIAVNAIPICVGINSMANMFIYLHRHRELRACIFQMFRRYKSASNMEIEMQGSSSSSQKLEKTDTVNRNPLLRLPERKGVSTRFWASSANSRIYPFSNLHSRFPSF